MHCIECFQENLRYDPTNGDWDCVECGRHHYMQHSPMLVMPGQDHGFELGLLCGTYPGRIGHLCRPGKWVRPKPELAYALDNGRFSCWDKGKTWNETQFLSMCENAACSTPLPLWVVVPDVVSNAVETKHKWDRWVPRMEQYKLPLAFAVQDGMTPDDVPHNAEVVFVGGTTEWKISNMQIFGLSFPRVHIGRVNGYSRLMASADSQAESCDGTGYFREVRGRQQKALHRFLSGNHHKTLGFGWNS